ncbi:unnamed protein product [Mytilus coruscus]|uniref:Uncharacterized protein n=1 Tax=Mytilus coruscus TaxID=42192 RepID=A0A6J8EKX8_MYTCO|nr:unnamed protein product [Mytilus coruscus]
MAMKLKLGNHSTTKKPAERRKQWEKLVNEGDYAHNNDVHESGKGEIIPKYRSSKEDDVIPCPFCHGMYCKSELWRHYKKCGESENKTEGKEGHESSALKIGPVASGKKRMPTSCRSQVFSDNILDNMRDDHVKAAVLSDPGIIRFGMNMHLDHGNQTHRHVYISNK